MFTLVVVFGNVHRDFGIERWRRACSLAEQGRPEGKAGDVFEHIGVLDGFGGRGSPGEGSVPGDQHTRDGDGVEFLGAEAAHDHRTRVAHVGLGDFRGGERLGDGDRAVEVVGVGGAEAGDGRPAWAQAVANSEWVWTTPPICGNSR